MPISASELHKCRPLSRPACHFPDSQSLGQLPHSPQEGKGLSWSTKNTVTELFWKFFFNSGKSKLRQAGVKISYSGVKISYSGVKEQGRQESPGLTLYFKCKADKARLSSCSILGASLHSRSLALRGWWDPTVGRKKVPKPGRGRTATG